MKQVTILIPKGHTSMVNIAGTHQMFSFVNEILGQQGKAPLFHIQLAAGERSMMQTNGLFSIHADLLVKDIKKTDLIIIPAIHGDFSVNLKNNADLIPWIIKQYHAGAEIVSLCVGSFFLASTGLLDGKNCSTHWQYANEFRKLFPKALLMDDKILTEADGIYTSGGAYSFTNLIIYLIEKFAGRDMAILVSKGFMIDLDRDSQSPFTIFSGQKNHKDTDILKAQDYIEKNFQEKLSIDSLCEHMALSRRTFERRFKKATANTIWEYLQRVKVEAAKKELEMGKKTVNEVMYKVGYTDPKAFRDVFRKITNMTPMDYLHKYSAQMTPTF